MTSGPEGDRELERQRAQIEAAFREGWRTASAGIFGVLSERDYAEARGIIDRPRDPAGKGRLPPFLTNRQRAAVGAVRQGAQAGDPLPPPRRSPFISGVTDAEVIMIGSGAGRRVAVLFCHEYFPGARFGHRFPLERFGQGHEPIWLKEEIETGALHRMMRNQPAADSAGIIWTTWGSPAGR